MTLTKIGVKNMSESKERLTYRPEPETRQKIAKLNGKIIGKE